MSEGRPHALYRPSRALAIWWIVAGVAGGIVSFLLYHEYIAQLRGEDARDAASNARAALRSQVGRHEGELRLPVADVAHEL